MTPTEALQLALNHRTSGDQLDAIGPLISRPKIGKALASNPNTSAQMAAKLLPRYPDEVLANPVFPLICLDNPRAFDILDIHALIPLLQKPELPESFLYALLRHPNRKVAADAQVHVGLGEAQLGWEREVPPHLGRLGATIDCRHALRFRDAIPLWLWNALPPAVRRTTEESLATPEFQEASLPVPLDPTPLTEEELQTLPTDLHMQSQLCRTTNRIAILRELRSMASLNPYCPADLLEAIAEEEFKRQGRVYDDVLQHPNTPVHVLERFAFANFYRAANGVALNPNTPLELLEKILPRVTALNANTPLATDKIVGRWQELSEFKRQHLNKLLLRRLDTPLDVWLKVMKEEFAKVNGLLNYFIITTLTEEAEEIIAALNYPYWCLRFAVVLNPAATTDQLTVLAGDANRYVRAAAQARLKDPNWRFEP